MKLIHRIHRFKKLSTLKHSCLLAISALKRSCICDETLLHSIYTYSYLYKNTCNWAQQIVNNFFCKKFKKIILSILVIISSIQLTACQQVIKIPITPEKHLDVTQEQATNTQPANFYVCGGNGYSCVTPTVKWQAKRSVHIYSKTSKTNVHKERKNANPKKYRNCLVK